jgi:hypothetical protein
MVMVVMKVNMVILLMVNKSNENDHGNVTNGSGSNESDHGQVTNSKC